MWRHFQDLIKIHQQYQPDIQFHTAVVQKLVHLVGCIIRIYHDARSPERQTSSSIITQSEILRATFFTEAF